jgi:hypothetical protein
MKITVKAKEDIDMVYGTLPLKALAGKTLELSPSHAEIALRTGKFEVYKETPETEGDEAQLEAEKELLSTRRAELMELSKADLLKAAEGIEAVKPSMTKEEIADEILKPRAPEDKE